MSAALALWLLAGRATADAPAFLVASLSGSALDCLRGRPVSGIALLACFERCAPIPWQLDERDGEGRWALSEGPDPNPEQPAGVIDDNDEIVWMAADAGRRARPEEIASDAVCQLEIALDRNGARTWVYAVTQPEPAARSPRRYVEYDPGADLIRGEHMVVGFAASTPRFFTLVEPGGAMAPNLLDRLKIRGSARLLGVVPFSRNEDDIEYALTAWHAGPIRVRRREYQWVRLASWLRTPIVETHATATRDGLVLPVRLRLNFPPTRFFGGIELQAALDFRGLDGWTVLPATGAVGGAVDGALGNWVALHGPSATVVLGLELGESLRSLRTSLIYRDGDVERPPETVPGERPALGFRLTDWSAIDGGQHEFSALAYVLPPDYDVGRFIRERTEPLVVSVMPLPHTE